ncbi:S-adenosyl-L-methionine-dependent methyltransferase [Paraphoma chrysanthemicola]|uniref:S-adenosyl-L-methionine-dependent methyltransferase n=1 Tax=Paraphoma chrysanthemicola TaxID=798071 RepID=A0A8K0VY45_9PLEO|nr:S-adenosyl-L-methionine-dependent methyltransferase [Paraphoma chrysanthemicola]
MSSRSSKSAAIGSLASHISELSSELSDHLRNSGHPDLTFTADSPTVPDTAEYEALRGLLNDAAMDLLHLLNGSKSTLRSFFLSHYDLAALQVALARGFFNHVPLPDLGRISESRDAANELRGASVEEIAEKGGISFDRTARVLKMLATHRIFEKVPGHSNRFQHTAASALMARDQSFQATADMQMDDMLRAASATIAAVERSPGLSTQETSPFTTAYEISMYEYYEQRPIKAARFAQAMSGWSQLDRQILELCETYPWNSFKNGKVMDVGGGSGHISIELARLFKSLRFVVQDISPFMLSQSQDEAIRDLNGRVTFQQHSYFDIQPVTDADAFFLRQCLHNNNDADCIKIIQALVPALGKCKRHTPLLINDVIMPEY